MKVNNITNVRKEIRIGILSGLVLGIILVLIGVGIYPVKAQSPLTLFSITNREDLPELPLQRDAATSDIIALMLNSHKLWKTIDANAITIWEPEKNPQVVKSSIQIIQNSQAYLTMQQYNVDNQLSVDFEWLSDGEMIYQQEHLRKIYAELSAPPYINIDVDSFGPEKSTGESIIVRHPMAMIIPSPIADYIYPVGLMQRSGTIDIVQTDDVVADRKTIVILWNGIDDNNYPTGKAKYWVDTETGIILKAQVYGGENGDTIVEETTFTNIVLDSEINPEIYRFQVNSEYKQASFQEFYGN